MAEVADLRRHGPGPQPEGLLHYRPWRGEPVREGRGGTLLFLLAQAALLGAMAALSGYPTLRLLAAGAFVGMWGLVVRARAWPIARVSLAMIFRRKLFWAVYALALMV